MKIKTGKGPKAAITPSHSLRRDRVKRWGALRSLLRLQPEPDEATHGQGWDRRGGMHDVGSPPHLRVIFALGRLILRPSLYPFRRIDSGLR
jgi:hypothetical protein